MHKIGTFKAKHSRDITGSRIGIGFECIERQMWDDTAKLYQYVGELGCKYARVQTGWFRCETKKGVYDFAWLETIVDQLLAQGVQPWFCLSYGNMLYTDSPHPDSAGYPPIYTSEARTAWEQYVAAVVRHFQGKVRHYEVWNEPDAGGFWARGVNQDEYLDLVRLTSRVIRSHDSSAQVLAGALAISFAWANVFPTIHHYLVGGIAEHIDIFTYHRYHIMPELQRREDVAALRELFDRYGGRHVQLWQAESGCPSCPSTTEALSNTPVDETIQAKVALRSLLSDLLHDISYTSWFHISDFKYYFRDGLVDAQNYFGLLTFDQPPRRKLAYYAVQRLCSLFDNNTTIDPAMKMTIDKKIVPERERFVFQKTLIALRKGMFRRRGWPLAVWWLPEDIIPAVAGHQPYAGEEVLLKIWAPERNIERPVVIDLLSGDVYGFAPEEISSESRGVANPLPVFDRAMLKDYPLIATDYDAVMDLIIPV